MPAFDPTRPFALLATGGNGALLFTRPRTILAGSDIEALFPALRRADGWLAGGLSFESGLLLEPRLARRAAAPFHWFGCFDAPERLSAARLDAFLHIFRQRRARTGPIEPQIGRDAFRRAVECAQGHIAAGDIYQVNLTFQAALPFSGHPLALFAQLFDPGASPHGGVVHDGQGRWWLSFSPELFFRLDEGRLLARPMKGTAARRADAAADGEAASALHHDTKNRAENLMITDLIRNDLGRVAATGSVRTTALYDVETYPSVHQMTSTVEARLREGLDAVDALAALFPCGSVTGAPKIRACELLHDLEAGRRGIYCGSIGWLAPGAGSASFNVAIRTIAIEGGKASLGLGAGITAGSDAGDEWAECLLKARFLQPASPRTLLETMRLEADGHIPRLALHLGRLQGSAARFAIPFDPAGAMALLEAAAGNGPGRLRLLLGSGGELALQRSPLPAAPAGPVKVALAALPLAADDWRLRHKSTARAFHDEARQSSGCFECLYEREDGLLTEGSFTSLFVPRGGTLLTPPLHLGLLPGTLRAELLQQGHAREACLRREDLAGGFYLGNSLRGLLKARLAAAD